MAAVQLADTLVSSITRTCGKMRFATRQAALIAAQNRAVSYQTRYRVYYHRQCLGWHLTTQTR